VRLRCGGAGARSLVRPSGWAVALNRAGTPQRQQRRCGTIALNAYQAFEAARTYSPRGEILPVFGGPVPRLFARRRLYRKVERRRAIIAAQALASLQERRWRATCWCAGIVTLPLSAEIRPRPHKILNCLLQQPASLRLPLPETRATAEPRSGRNKSPAGIAGGGGRVPRVARHKLPLRPAGDHPSRRIRSTTSRSSAVIVVPANCAPVDRRCHRGVAGRGWCLLRVSCYGCAARGVAGQCRTR
jgi:hypothetical protein